MKSYVYLRGDRKAHVNLSDSKSNRFMKKYVVVFPEGGTPYALYETGGNETFVVSPDHLRRFLLDAGAFVVTVEDAEILRKLDWSRL